MADEAQRRREQHMLSLQTSRVAEAPSLGEILLPFLFAAMETCWIDAIFIGLAGIDFFASRDPFMPLWTPFVIITGTQWILSRLELRAAGSATEDEIENGKKNLPGSSIFVAFVCVVTLFVIWISIYAQQAFFLDPRWLLALLNDVLSLNLYAYHTFFILAITGYLCWRGMRLLHREHEPSQVFSTLRLGMGIIIGVVLVRAGQTSAGVVFHDNAILLLLIPIFLFLSLTAHALARVNFVRHMHATNDEDDISPHEQAILVTIGMVGIVLLIIALVVDLVASSTILAGAQQIFNILGQAYDWFVSILATVFAFLATPFFWLFEWWTTLFPQKLPSGAPGNTRAKLRNPVSHVPQIAGIVLFVKILLPILLIAFAVLLIRWIIRRRRRVRLATRRRAEELHESLWSWQLFWTQFKALLRALFGRFLPRQATREEQVLTEAIQGEPAARSVREIYRAFLKRAATLGYPRKKNETPYEFKQRLDAQTPLAQPQIALVTEVYTATRYGGAVPDEAEVARVRQEWTELEQKWREASR
jgi:hypothetical protein